MRASWTIDELAHAGAEHLDPAFVAAYDRKAGFVDGPDHALANDLDAFAARGLDGGATVGDPRAGYTGDDYAEHIRGEHSTFRWLFEPLLTAAGFDTVGAEYRDRVYGAYTCVRR